MNSLAAFPWDDPAGPKKSLSWSRSWHPIGLRLSLEASSLSMAARSHHLNQSTPSPHLLKQIEVLSMSVYAVFIREMTKNEAELAAYMPKAAASMAGHPMTVLAAYGRQEVLEGPDVEGVVIVEFPSFDDAKAWYESPPIATPASIVFHGADYRAIIVEEYSDPHKHHILTKPDYMFSGRNSFRHLLVVSPAIINSPSRGSESSSENFGDVATCAFTTSNTTSCTS